MRYVSTSDFQSEVGEVFGEIGGELPAKFGRRFSSFVCWGNSSEAFSAKSPPQISPSNFTTRFWVVAGPRKFKRSSSKIQGCPLGTCVSELPNEPARAAFVVIWQKNSAPGKWGRPRRGSNSFNQILTRFRATHDVKRAMLGALRCDPSGSEKGVFWKRGLFRKVHFLEILETLEIF